MRCCYIVAAAGVGKRMGLGYPKQFLEYRGRPLFITTVEKIAASKKVEKIVVVTNEENIESVKENIKNYISDINFEVVSGGKERQDSIYNGLKLIENEGFDYVAVHDGVRPFITERYIEESIDILEKNSEIDGVVVGVKVKDTIKIIDKHGNIESTPDRNSLMAAQTPQLFRFDKLKTAYEKAFESGFYGTDDSSLVERCGGVVAVLEGSYENIKITTVEDLKHLEEAGV